MAREGKEKEKSPDLEQTAAEEAGGKKRKEAKTVPPGVSGELLGRAIWRETVIKAKGEKVDEGARETQWKADRKQYIGMGRRIVGRLNQNVRRRSKAAAE